ncbi:MAG: hypothetical protein Q8N84_00905 [bacterium]|nr:hypothetical protein [bacterium]
MKSAKKLSRILALGLMLALALGNFSWIPQARAASLTAGSVALSDARASGTTVSYTLEFSGITLSGIKCIKVVFSTLATGGTTPTGLATTGATYDAAGSDYVPDVQTWTADGTTTPGTVVITTPTTAETPGSATDGTVLITGLTNGSTAETGYYAQFSTYTATNCTGAMDSGTGVYIFTTGQAVSLTVDPTISFNIAAVADSETVNGADLTVTTTDGTIPFATVTASANAIAAHDTTVTTNAGTGYTTSIRYLATPSDGSADIDDVSPGTNGSPQSFSAAGVEAFGYTTNDATLSAAGDGVDRFTNPTNQWAKFTTSNAEVAYNDAAISASTTRVGYQVGVSNITKASTYTATVIITCTPQY